MNSIGAWLGRWVEVCEHRPRQVLAVIGVLTALAAAYVAASFSVDSNLDKLIRPSGQLSWFEANETLKALFPEQQQTSVVVVSGPDLDAVDRTASRLQAAFSAEPGFEFVFAPALSPFLPDAGPCARR